MPGQKKTLLVLYPNDWDRGELAREKYRDAFPFEFYGTRALQAPRGAAAPPLRPGARRAAIGRPVSGRRALRRHVVGRIRRRGDGGGVGRDLGLPHADPAHIVTAQHKYLSRRSQKDAVPEAVPDFALVPLSTKRPDTPLPYPFFVKPVKGTFSLFAKKVDDARALADHLDFKLWERFALGVSPLRSTRWFAPTERAASTRGRSSPSRSSKACRSRSTASPSTARSPPWASSTR